MQLNLVLSDSNTETYKAVLVGPQSSGKSSLLHRLRTGQYSDTYTPTIGLDFQTYTAELGTNNYALQIWDTAGQEKFRSLTRSYFKGTSACICVFDLMDQASLGQCEHYMRMAVEEGVKEECLLLVGNKLDLGEKLRSEGLLLSEQFRCHYSVVSAKTGSGVVEAINGLLMRVKSSHTGSYPRTHGMELKPTIFVEQSRSGCRC